MRLTGILFLSLVLSPVLAQKSVFNIIFRQDFEKTTPGVYNYTEWKRDWNSPAYVNNLEHTYIVSTGNGNRAMKWVYPAGSVGPHEGGGQFEAPVGKPVDEVYMSYNIKFRPGFEWVLGGKLPGLTGGPHSYFPGVEKPHFNDGFSNGLMWGHDFDHVDADGAIYFYTYYQDMPGLYGQSFRWGSFKFDTDPGRWYNITIRMVMNTVRSDGTGGNYDGIMEGFVDGRLLVSETGLRFRNTADIHIDKMKIYSHFGGSGPEYGALRDEWLLLDDVYLFTYKQDPGVPVGNVPSKAGRVLQLPNLKRVSQHKSADINTLAAPVGLQVTGNTGKTVSLRWDAPGNNLTIAGYHVYVDDRDAGTTGNTSFTVEGLSPATVYSMAVSAYDGSGNESPKSPMVRATTSGRDTIPPEIPSGLSSLKSTDQEVYISWKPSRDNTGVTGYRIYVNGGEQGTSPGPSYTVKHLSPSSKYKISVSAFDRASNESKRSKEMKVETSGPDLLPPSVPTGLYVTRRTENNVTISWKQSDDNFGVAGYAIFLDGVFKGTTMDTTYIIKGLQPGLTYAVTVTAFDAHSNKSAASKAIKIALTGEEGDQ